MPNHPYLPVLKAYWLGVVIIFLRISSWAVITLWLLQVVALGLGETHDWGAVLWHIFLLYSFVVFYPGQRLWTFRMRDSTGREHTIIGQAEPVD